MRQGEMHMSNPPDTKGVAGVASVNTRTGVVVLVPGDVGITATTPKSVPFVGAGGLLGEKNAAFNFTAASNLLHVTGGIEFGATLFKIFESSAGVAQLGSPELTFLLDTFNSKSYVVLSDPNATFPDQGFVVRQQATPAAGDYLDIAMSTTAEAGNLGMGLVQGPAYSSTGRQFGFVNQTPDDGNNVIYIASGSSIWQFWGAMTTGGALAPASDNTQDLGGLTAIFGSDYRLRTGYFGTSVNVTPVAVLSLPSAATTGTGAMAFVNDALTPVFGAIVATGGLVTVPVYSDGTNWRVG